MKKLIIPRGASPRRYKELVASGEVVPQYIEIDEEGKSSLLDFMDKQKKVQDAFEDRLAKPKSKPRKKKVVPGYQDGDRGFNNGGR